MKIVHYMEAIRLTEGGVTRAVLDLCAVLAARGHEVTVLTQDAPDIPDAWTQGAPDAPQCVTLEAAGGLLPRLKRRAAADAATRIAEADVLHLHVPWDPICLHLSRMARRLGVPYFVSLHGMLDDWCMGQKGLKKRAWLAVSVRSMLEGAAAVHCTAQAEADQSSKWYPRGRPVVLPLIFDLEPFEHLPGPELARRRVLAGEPADDAPRVLFLSRIHPKKRLDLLLEAAARLRDEGRPVRVLVAGTGEPAHERETRELVRRLSLEEHVRFLGFVSGDEKLSLYQAADVFVLPTHQENWGFVLIEALACGTPVLTTRGVDIWPELRDSGGAVIVDPTASQVAQAVEEIVGAPARRDEMGRRGRAWVMANLPRDVVASRYESAYARAAGVATPPARTAGAPSGP